jgi:hypothetical protein
VRQGGALYLPYRFDFPLHGNPNASMRAPWYSGMAQGQALSLFVRLHEVTGDRRWLDAADAVFRTFLMLRPTGGAPGTPWIAFVDEAGYYWPEEYPDAIPDRTFNGIVFAAYGLIDYHFATADPDALRLAQATLTTALAALPQIRVLGQVSRYCLEHGVQDERYHRVHIGQMRTLARITADPRFAEWERLLRADADP